ncbi:MAG: putative periplasmic lipoprotein [Bacteroidetes bacterium]|nr:MAG: putative periplasmic lipoprotein [Bacteroidota bacterium]
MDKAGHAMTCYYTGRIGMNLLRWSGVKEKKAVWFGGLTGFVYLGAIEMLDGFSSGWGFSSGDMAANTLGTALLIGQEYAWKDQRIALKFSSHKTDFPVYRPELLGETRLQQVLKDYNGQTYWLSVNIASFLKKETKVPAWLNLAFGYSAEGMTGGKENAVTYNASGNIIDFPRYRQYYLSFDIDLTKIAGQSPFMRALTQTFGFIKIPAPTLAFDRQGFGAYWIYM